MNQLGMTRTEADEIGNSSYWKSVQRECDYRIEMLERQLRTCKEENLKEIQVKLQMWEEFKQLPSSVEEREG